MGYSIAISCLFLLLNTSLLLGSPTDSTKVLVLDQSDRPVSGVKVTIDNNSPQVTNSSGAFKFVPTRKLEMPLSMNVAKDGYELDEYIYSENDKEIEIRLKVPKVSSKSYTLHLISNNGQPLANVIANYNSKSYTSNANGDFKVDSKNITKDALTVTGFKIDKFEVSDKRYTYNIQLSPAKIESVPALIEIASNDKVEEKKEEIKNEPQPISEEAPAPSVEDKELQEVVFKQYQEGFENISREIIQERTRLLENNKKIRNEIEQITKRLKEEQNLNPEQRKKLKAKVENLEKTLMENTIAYNQAEEKTRGLILNLKYMLMQKDSLNFITAQKLKIEESKRILSEKKAKRTLIIFTIITISLLFLAVVFYAIARKMRAQRYQLQKNLEELQHLREEMGKGLQV